MKLKYKPLFLLFIITFFSSCLNNIDFDQVNLDLEPVINTPLVFFELDQLDFFDELNNTEIETVTDISDLEVLESSTVRDNLLKVDFTFEADNRFDRNIFMEIDFLDDSENITFSLNSFTIAAGNRDYRLEQTIDIVNSPGFLNSTKIRARANLTSSNITIDPSIPSTLGFKSSAVFFLSF